jgi:hypothetical protein
MGNQWEFLFEDGENFSEIRKRHRMEKTAGVFMRPSDIAGHTDLAATLESMLNGQPGGSTFKDQPGEQKVAGVVDVAVGAAVGGTTGYYATNKINPVPPPEDTKGFRNKVQQVRHDIHQFTAEHPKTTRAVGAVTGALTGGFVAKDLDLAKRLSRFKRGTP